MLQMVLQLGPRAYCCYFPGKLEWPTYAFEMVYLLTQNGFAWTPLISCILVIVESLIDKTCRDFLKLLWLSQEPITIPMLGLLVLMW